MIATLKAKAIAAAVVLGIGFGGGWVVHGWKTDASELAERRATDAAFAKELERLKDFNDKAAKREGDTLASIRGLNEALGKLKDEINDLAMGGCNLTPDADRVRSEAYRQAFPPR